MKQTNNAIKFLMAQYRAIFKHAYLKGLVSVAVLTAGLATATTANAATNLLGSGNTLDSVFTDASSIYTIKGSGASTDPNDKEFDQINNTTFTTAPLSELTGKLTILSGSATTFTGSSGNVIQFTGSTDTKISGSEDGFSIYINAEDDDQGLALVTSTSTKSTFTWDITDITIDQGVLNLGIDSSGGASGSLVADAETIQIGSNYGNGNDAIVSLATKGTYKGQSGANASITLGQYSSNSGSQITLNKNGIIEFGGQNVTGTGTQTILDGESLSANGGLLDFTSGSGIVKVATQFEGIPQDGNEPGTDLDVTVGAGKTASIQLNSYTDANTNAHRGILHFGKGSVVDLQRDGTTAGGGILEITANASNSGSIVKFESGSIIKSTEQNTSGTAVPAYISVSGAGTGNGVSELHIEGNVLKNFLESDDSDDHAGAILLSGNSLFAIDTSETVELAATADDKTNVYNLGELFKSGTNVTNTDAGKIVLAAATTIKASNMSISGAVKTAQGGANISVEADHLTLGNADFNTSTDTFDTSGATVHNSLNLIASGDKFNTQAIGTLNLSNSYYVQDKYGFNTTEVSPVQTISGADLIVDDDVTVNGGNWKFDKDLTVSGTATLTVTSTSGTTVYSSFKNNDGEFSRLTLNGNVTLTAGEIDVTGTKGADAVLDLTNAKEVNFTGSTEITLSGTAVQIYNSGSLVGDPLPQSAGYGVLKIDGDAFTGYTSSTTTKLTVDGGGVLYVTTPDNGTYNFTDFIVTPGTGATAGAINFDGAGYVVFDGDLTLTTDSTDKNGELNIGAGTIVADTITLNNLNKTNEKLNAVTLASGNLIVHEGLTTNSGKLVIGTSGASTLKFYGTEGQSGTVATSITSSGSAGNTVEFKTGNWSALDIDLATSTTAKDTLTVGTNNELDPLTILNAGNLAAGTSDEINVGAQGQATFSTAQITNGAEVNVSGSMTVTGKADIQSGTVAYNQGLAGVTLKGSSIEVTADGAFVIGDTVLAAKDSSSGNSVSFTTTGSGTNTVTTANINDALKATYTINHGAELVLDFSAETSTNIFGKDGLTSAQAAALKEGLFPQAGSGKLDGILNLGDTALDIVWSEESTSDRPVATWENVKDFAQITGGDVTTNQLKKALIKEISQQDNAGGLSGQYGAVQVDADYLEGNALNVTNDFGLHNAYEISGVKYYAFKNHNGKITALKVHSTAGDVTYAGGGYVGETTVDDGTLVVLDGETYILGKLTAKKGLDLTGTLHVSGDSTISGDMDIYNGATYHAQKLTLDTAIGEIMGDVYATDVKFTSSFVDVVGGLFSADTVTLDGNSTLAFGYKNEDNLTQDDADTIYNDLESYGGEGYIGQLVMNGGFVGLDPEYTTNAAIVAVTNLSGTQSVGNLADINAGTLDGKVYVGQNSILGIGVDSLDELKEATAGYMNGIALNGDDTGAVLYLNKQFKIGNNDTVVLTAQSPEKFVSHYNSGNGTSGSDTNADLINLANTLYLGEKTALTITANVTSNSPKGGTAMVEFESNDGKVIADGGRIDLTGNVRANTTYQVFDDASGGVTISYLDGKDYDPTTDAIEVATENGFLEGVVATDGTVALGVSKNARAVMTGASDPVFTSLVAYANGYNGDDSTVESAQLYDGYTEQKDANGNAIKNYNYNNDVLQHAITTGNGAMAEQVARLGIYGGSVQAAISAGATTSDAVSARMGMGAQTGSVTFADNGQGAGLWVSPIYKSHDSDGFGTQGLSYGADMDLYGVALGGDFTMANGLRVGAAFNVGSGDADGQGAGVGVSNDFDYFGFTVYGGYTMDKMSVVGDISYTVVDNDVSANTALGKVSSTMDTTNLSVGVTGQYTLSLDAMDVTPHAGLRYTYVDMDDYTVKGDADVAHYAGDSMSIFSIPVGVTFSKDIVAGAWTVKPSFDLTLTANVGDDEIDGSVTWAGVDNLQTNLTSEVVDTFTYGATAGISAKTGNFSFGFGVNYTGASSADEYGVKANARFMF